MIVFLKTITTTLLITCILTPFAAWLFRRKFLVGKWYGPGIAFVVSVLAGAVLYVGGVWLIGQVLEYEMYQFDLDGDGFLSESEMTPAANEAMDRFQHDTGRTFAPIVALPASFVWSVIVFAICSSICFVLSLFRKDEMAASNI